MRKHKKTRVAERLGSCCFFGGDRWVRSKQTLIARRGGVAKVVAIGAGSSGLSWSYVRQDRRPASMVRLTTLFFQSPQGSSATGRARLRQSPALRSCRSVVFAGRWAAGCWSAISRLDASFFAYALRTQGVVRILSGSKHITHIQRRTVDALLDD